MYLYVRERVSDSVGGYMRQFRRVSFSCLSQPPYTTVMPQLELLYALRLGYHISQVQERQTFREIAYVSGVGDYLHSAMRGLLACASSNPARHCLRK